MTAYKARWTMDQDGAWVAFQVGSPGQAKSICESFPERGATLQVGNIKKRSLDANAYMWVLCQKIAEKIRSTKESVYKQMVRESGQFEILPVRDDAVEGFIRKWEGHGSGWPAWVEDDSKIPGYKRLVCCFGSSTYNTKEMSVLLDEIVYIAKEMGIETLPPEKIKQMEERWGN